MEIKEDIIKEDIKVIKDMPIDDAPIFRNHVLLILQQYAVLVAVLGAFFFSMLQDMIKDRTSFDQITKDFSALLNNTESLYQIVFLISLFIIAVLIGLRGFFIWKNTIIKLYPDRIYYYKYGLFNRHEKQVNYRYISNVTVKGSLFGAIFGVKKVTIDINSSVTAKHDDYWILLSTKNAEIFRSTIYNLKEILMSSEDEDYSEENSEVSDSNNIDLANDVEARDDLSENSILAENSSIKIQNVNYTRIFTLREKILHIVMSSGNSFLTLFIGIAIIITSIVSDSSSSLSFLWIILILPALKAIYSNINRYSGFSVSRNEDVINIKYGLVDTRNYTIEVKNILAINEVQGFIPRIFGYAKLNFEIIGVKNNKDESSDLCLYLKKSKLLEYANALIPEYPLHGTSFTNGVISSKELPLNSADPMSRYGTEEFSPQDDKFIAYIAIKSAIIIGIILFVIYITGLLSWIMSKSPLFISGFIAIWVLIYLYRIVANSVGKALQVKSDRIILKTGILSKNTENMPFKKADIIVIQSGFIPYLLGLYSVTFKSKGSLGMDIHETGYYKFGTFDEIIKRFQNGHEPD